MSIPTNPIFQFKTAERKQCKASIMIEGLSGRGKSGLALALAYYLAGEDWTGVKAIDTENKSLDLFDGVPSSFGVPYQGFQIGALTPEIGYKPSHYIAFKEAAIESGAKVLIKDSVSHAWMYKGGVLDLVNAAKAKSTHYSKDKYAAWGDEEVVDEKLKLFDLLRDHRIHVITTVRVKEKMEYDTDDKGKTILTSLGEQQIMQADIKYEPDLVLSMLRPGKNKNGQVVHPQAKVIKSRYAILSEGEIYDFTPELMKQLRDYLEEGTSPEEILEQQRQEYVSGVKEYLDAKGEPTVTIWKKMKSDAGHAETPLDDLPLAVIKKLFIALTLD